MVAGRLAGKTGIGLSPGGSESFGDLLGGMTRLFPPALLSGRGCERLRAIAGRLPSCVIEQLFGFEFALDRQAPTADFCVVPERGSGLAAHYIRAGEAAPADSAWAALGRFLAQDAGDPTSFLASRDGGVILEYDVPEELPDEPSPPGIFLVSRTAGEGGPPTLHDDPTRTVTGLWTAVDWRPCREELREVGRLYEALPDTGCVVQAGVLPGRPERALRFVIHRVDAEEIPGLLDRLRWPGSIGAVRSVLAHASDVAARVALSIDVAGRGVSRRLGLELFRPVKLFQREHGGWLPMIDRLLDRAWCVPAKAEGLRAWPRYERLFGRSGIYLVHQAINHFKVVVEPGRIGAKAYAAMFVRRLDTGGGKAD